MVLANKFSVHQAVSVLLAMLILVFSSSVIAAEFEAGKDYVELSVQDKIEGDNIIVREFFWYGCPHCYHLEPHVQAWEKTKADDVTFLRTPAPLNPIWEANARGYYAAQALGLADKSHSALMHAIHEKNQRLFSKNTLADFYASLGADKAAFKTHYTSPDVDKKIDLARSAAFRYKLTGVPAIVVQGRFVVKGTNEKTFEVVNYLVDKIRAERVSQ